MTPTTTKVLHVLDVLRPSGAETTLVVAGERWAELGVTCDVLATGTELGTYARPLRDAGYRTGRLPLDPFISFAPRFLRLLKAEGYDAVHNHVERANFYITLLARSAGVEAVQSLHNLFAFSGMAAAERRVQRAIMRRAGVRFVSVSEDVRAHEVEQFGNPSQVITNWFDDSEHQPVSDRQRAEARSALGVGPEDLVIASVGNCNDAKNHTTILQAIAALGRADIVYLHAGTGEDEQEEQRLASALGIADQVRFLGFVPAAPVIRAADVYAMPSLVEGQGIAAIEAVATAVPVLLADTPGLRTLKGLDPAITWCAPTDAGVTDALRRLLDAPPSAADLHRAAAAAAGTFSPDAALASFAALYRGER